MKRFFYIIILSAAAILLIMLLDVFTSKEERPPEEYIVEEPPRIERPAEFDKEFFGKNLTLPRYDTVPLREGGEVKVQTATILAEELKHEFGNQFAARGITFTLYDEDRYERPLEERVVAKGRADRALLFAKSEEGIENFEIEPKKEFVLKDNVEIDTFDPQTKEISFSLSSENLVFLDDALIAKGPARIYNEET